MPLSASGTAYLLHDISYLRSSAAARTRGPVGKGESSPELPPDLPLGLVDDVTALLPREIEARADAADVHRDRGRVLLPVRLRPRPTPRGAVTREALLERVPGVERGVLGGALDRARAVEAARVDVVEALRPPGRLRPADPEIRKLRPLELLHAIHRRVQVLLGVLPGLRRRRVLLRPEPAVDQPAVLEEPGVIRAVLRLHADPEEVDDVALELVARERLAELVAHEPAGPDRGRRHDDRPRGLRGWFGGLGGLRHIYRVKDVLDIGLSTGRR